MALGAWTLVACSGWAQQVFNLRAEVFTKTLAGGRQVQMWGYALDAAAPTSPGPVLTVSPTATEVVINLTNNLAVPTSIVIPNQNGFVRDAAFSTFADSQGRVRASSFVKETAPGATVQYRWQNVTPGTYIYYSGSHAALQVQMGLYGALKQNDAAGRAYPGVNYTNEVLLLFSEVDVDVHDQVQAGTYGTAAPGAIKSMVHSVPEYFLINGESYTAAQVALAGGQVGQPTLFRLLNACADTRVPVINYKYVSVVAEDGRVAPHPVSRFEVDLPALKTRDALFTPDQSGTLVVFDRRLGLTNGPAANGGMIRTLQIAPPGGGRGVAAAQAVVQTAATAPTVAPSPAVVQTAVAEAPVASSRSVVQTAVAQRPTPGISPEQAAELADTWGIKIAGLLLSADGLMVDFRYRILDSDKAAALSDPAVKPYLVDSATGTKLLVPDTPKIGPLRARSKHPVPERVYFVLFGNTNRVVKSGSQVSIVIGDCHIDNIVVP